MSNKRQRPKTVDSRISRLFADLGEQAEATAAFNLPPSDVDAHVGAHLGVRPDDVRLTLHPMYTLPMCALKVSSSLTNHRLLRLPCQVGSGIATAREITSRSAHRCNQPWVARPLNSLDSR